MFFVAEIWRGRLTGRSMRLFPHERGVRHYLEELDKKKRGGLSAYYFRVYELFPDTPPKNVTVRFREWLGMMQREKWGVRTR